MVFLQTFHFYLFNNLKLNITPKSKLFTYNLPTFITFNLGSLINRQEREMKQNAWSFEPNKLYGKSTQELEKKKATVPNVFGFRNDIIVIPNDSTTMNLNKMQIKTKK